MSNTDGISSYCGYNRAYTFKTFVFDAPPYLSLSDNIFETEAYFFSVMYIERFQCYVFFFRVRYTIVPWNSASWKYFSMVAKLKPGCRFLEPQQYYLNNYHWRWRSSCKPNFAVNAIRTRDLLLHGPEQQRHLLFNHSSKFIILGIRKTTFLSCLFLSIYMNQLIATYNYIWVMVLIDHNYPESSPYECIINFENNNYIV